MNYIYISYSIFLSGSFDARSSPTHQRFLPWRILAFSEVFNHGKMLGKTHQWGFYMLENPVLCCLNHHNFREIASLTSPRNSMDWRAALDILREMQVEEVAPDLPLCRGMVSASGLNSLLLSCHTEINHEKGWCIWSSIFWDTWELTYFCGTLTFAGCTPIWVFQQKGIPWVAPICATNHFCRLTTQFGWLYGGFHTLGVPQ